MGIIHLPSLYQEYGERSGFFNRSAMRTVSQCSATPSNASGYYMNLDNDGNTAGYHVEHSY